MFQYTTETIINSNEGSLDGVRFNAYQADYTVATGSSDAKYLVVDGVNTFDKAHVTAIYKQAYVAPVNEVVAITIPAAGSGTTAAYAVGDVLRFEVKTQQEGLTSSIYADAQKLHKKPFFYEITVATATPAGVAAQLKAAIDKEMAMTDFKFFAATVDSSNNLVLTAKDCYTRFEFVHLGNVFVNEINTVNLGSALTGYEDYVALIDWKRAADTASDAVALTKGTEGAGTVARLIKNLRIPTDANTNPFGPDMGGKPVPGGQYTQYTLEYKTPRRHIGGQVVGAMDESLTTHIFFIHQSIQSAFETKLGYIGTVTPVPQTALTNAAAKAPQSGSRQ